MENELKKVYLAFDGTHYKIGQSVHPKQRILELKKQNPKIELIHYGYGGTKEQEIHKIFKKQNVFSEWFILTEKQKDYVIYLINNKVVECSLEKGLNPIQQDAQNLINDLRRMQVKSVKSYFTKIIKKQKNRIYTKNKLNNLWYGKTTDVRFNEDLKYFKEYFQENYTK